MVYPQKVRENVRLKHGTEGLTMADIVSALNDIFVALCAIFAVLLAMLFLKNMGGGR